MNLLSELPRSLRDNFSTRSDANHGRFCFESYCLTLFLIGCLLSIQIEYSFYHTPKRIRLKDHSPVAKGAYSDEE
jgi:hypothetical protein